jgi:hypothetical protein
MEQSHHCRRLVDVNLRCYDGVTHVLVDYDFGVSFRA